MRKAVCAALAVIVAIMCAGLVACSGGNSSKSAETPKVVEYSYTPGVLHQAKDLDGQPAVPSFKVSGVIFVRDRHNDAEEQLAVGYRNSNIADEFYRGEQVSVYMDEAACSMFDEGTEIVALPHHEMADYATMDVVGIEQEAADNGGFVIPLRKEAVQVSGDLNLVGTGFVDGHATPGEWDVLFMKDGKVSAYVCVNTTVELKERGL